MNGKDGHDEGAGNGSVCLEDYRNALDHQKDTQ
jgi:hypothetical protein